MWCLIGVALSTIRKFCKVFESKKCFDSLWQKCHTNITTNSHTYLFSVLFNLNDTINLAAYILKILFCAEMAVQPSKDQPCLARSSSGLSLLESGRKLFLQSETAKHLLLSTVISQSSCFKKQATKESESQILSFTLAIGKDIQLSLYSGTLMFQWNVQWLIGCSCAKTKKKTKAKTKVFVRSG